MGFAGFAFLFGAALNEAWVPGRISAARRSRESVARGDGAREESQELMDQLADDMDELMRLLQEGKTEGEDSSEDSNEDSSESGVDMVDGDVDDLEASPETNDQALVTVDTQAAQAISCLDLSGLQRVPGSSNEYIVTSQQLQSIVNSKVQQYTAVIKGFEKYIEELEEDLESKEAELEEKDATLQVENKRRQALEAELLTLKGRAEEMEQQLADAQEATLDATSMLANLDQQAERIAERVTSGEISEEESHEIEEELIRAQAKRLAASKSEERSEQQLDEVRQAAEEATQRALEAEERQQVLSEELQSLQRSLQEVQEQRDAEAQKREVADLRFNELVTRLQERVSKR